MKTYKVTIEPSMEKDFITVEADDEAKAREIAEESARNNFYFMATEVEEQNDE